MQILVIDDQRTLDNFTDNITYARTYLDAVTEIYRRVWDQVYLDHDLGDNSNVYELCLLIERQAYEGQLIPVKEFIIISANPIGRMRMYQALHKFYNVRFAWIED